MKNNIAVLVLTFAVMYLSLLGARPLVEPDETRYAEIPREMIASGDWVVPHLNGVVYFEKPVLGYWVNAISMKIFGENRFAVRFPLALSAGLTAMFVFFLARRFLPDPAMAVPAAFIFLTFLEVFCVGVFNTLDSLLSLFITGSMAMFFMAWSNRDSMKHYLGYLVLSGLFCGLACHTKGFLAFAVPVIVIVPFVIWEGRWKSMFTIPWIPVSVALLVMLPWGIMIHLRDPDFWPFFFWNEHIRRFMAENAQHTEPFYYFIVVLAGGMFPWTLLLPAAVRGLWTTGFSRSFSRFAVCWFIFPFLFFSASSGKLATYILPCFPPLALLMTWGLFEIIKTGHLVFVNRSIRILVLFPILAVTAVLLLQHGYNPKIDVIYQDGRKIIVFLAAMAWLAFFLVASVRQQDPVKKILLFALSPVLFYTAAHVLTPDHALLRNSPVPFILENADRISPDALIVSRATPIKSVCWALKRDDIFLLDSGGELSYGFSREDQRSRNLDLDDFDRMVSENKGKRQVVLILDERRYKRLKDRLPAPDTIMKSGEDGYIFATF